MSNEVLFPLVPPVITIRNQLVGAVIGSDLVLECETEAFPKPVSYWSRESGEIVPVGKIFIPITFIEVLIFDCIIHSSVQLLL